MNDKTQAVLELVADVLKVPAEKLPPGASMETVAEWDSLAQLSICLSFQERFGVVMDMETIASATSVPALLAVLQR